jgi:hypothetical protein
MNGEPSGEREQGRWGTSSGAAIHLRREPIAGRALNGRL